MHARKTRERKKAESLALQQRIEELTDEGKFLRHMAMDRHTASVLVALTSQTASAAASGNLLANAEVMEGRVHTVALPAHLSKYATSTVNPLSPHPSAAPQEKVKRSRSRQECSPQEGLRLRRERNRLHAKRTRDRKRFAQEESERIIQEMEAETLALRQYLVSINLLSAEDMAKSIERDSTSRKMLAQLKGMSISRFVVYHRRISRHLFPSTFFKIQLFGRKPKHRTRTGMMITRTWTKKLMAKKCDTTVMETMSSRAVQMTDFGVVPLTNTARHSAS